MGARAKHQALHSPVLRRLGLKKSLDINCSFMKMCMLNVYMFSQVVEYLQLFMAFKTRILQIMKLFFLILYVGDAARLGGPLPKPTIRYSRQAGEGEWFHYIEVYI